MSEPIHIQTDEPQPFAERVLRETGRPLMSAGIEVVQVNIGLRCNLECEHCHVVSSPKRTEQMDWSTMEQVVGVANTVQPSVVDITGGAPEMHPRFREFVELLHASGHHVQVRTNLTIFYEPGYDWLPGFFRDHQVELVASMPCYLKDNVDRQRGTGTFDKSVEALRWLNSLGYGRDSALPLHLVYNPTGVHLPPDQAGLEADYRQRLADDHDIYFTGLFTITNMPIGRWRADLQREGRLDDYLGLLASGFNSETVPALMCRHQIEIGWDGTLYDCDFHLAHRLGLHESVPGHVRDFDPDVHSVRTIVTRDYCYGCTAGAGSSCGGALA